MVKKLNRNYTSFFDVLIFCFKNENTEAHIPWGYGYRYNDGIDDTPKPIFTAVIAPYPEPEDFFYYKHQREGMLRPLSKMKKDFTDTVRPYYSHKKYVKDWLQPIRGLQNIISGMFSVLSGLLFTGLLVAASPIILCIVLRISKGPLADFIRASSWIIRGTLDIIRGITQILTTPLVYFLKIPLRSWITRKQKETLMRAEEKPEIKRLAQKALDYIEKADLSNEESVHIPMRIMYEINRKFTRSLNDGWKTNLNREAVNSSFQQCSSRFFKAYPPKKDIINHHGFFYPNGQKETEENNTIDPKFKNDSIMYLKYFAV